jgi:DNA-binding response OmpR family regulator
MSKGKILVVDDSPLVRKLAEASLQEAGYEIYTADDGEEGLKIADTINPDLILVDFIMPKMTGSQFCKLLQENEKLKNIPIILITGKGEEVGKKFAEKFGVLDYFVKPFKSEDLVDKVNAILGGVTEISEIPGEFELKEVEELKEIEVPLEEKEELIEEIPFKEKTFVPEESILQPSLTEEIDIKAPSEEEKLETVEKISEEPSLVEETPSVPEEISLETKEEIIPEITEELILPEEKPIIPEEEIPIKKEEIEELGLPQPEELEEMISLKGVMEEESQVIEEIEKPEIPEEKEIHKIYEDSLPVSNLEEIIETKIEGFFQKEFPLILDNSLELLLKKYGIVKDTSTHLSGSLESFRVFDIFELISSNRLKGRLYLYSNKFCFEFLFIDGEIVYGISNTNKAKLGLKLMHELSDEEIKELTFDAVSLLSKTKEGSFIFEKKDFIEMSLLNRKRYTPSELFKGI